MISSLRDQFRNHKKLVYVKFILAILASIGIMINAKTTFLQSSEDFPEIKDRVFEFTAPLNRFLFNHSMLRKILMIISSLIMDIQLISYIGTYLFYAKSHRMVADICTFYAVRGLLQVLKFTQYLCVLPFAHDYIWSIEAPGFPSLSIAYSRTSDFFYSGHVGSSTISFFEFKTRGFKKLKTLSFISILFQGFITIVTRSHWTIDVFAGFIVAHYFFILAKHYIPEELESIKNSKQSNKKFK